MSEIQDTVDRLIEAVDASETELAALRAERDELRAALGNLAEAYEARMGDWENADFNEVYNVARRLLTTATAEREREG